MIEPTRHVKVLAPYQMSASAVLTLKDKAEYLKLDFNEATFPPSPLVKARLLELLQADQLNFYPDVTATELRRKLAAYVGLEAAFIQVFNGSDSAIDNICATFVGASDRVLVREPVYTQPFTFIRARGSRLVAFTGDDPFTKNLDEFERQLSARAIKMVYLANPNNPTGVYYELPEISRLLDKFPGTLFVIDEAYHEYAGKTSLGLVKDHQNLIVTRTFSKAFGLAGLRIGYIIAQPQLIGNIDKVRNGKDVNTVGQTAAMAALDDLPYVRRRVGQVIEARRWLIENLRRHGVACHDSPANFILIRVPDAPAVVWRLAEKKVLVRDRSSLPQMEGYIRVTIGLPEEMERFFTIFTSLPDSLIKR